MRKIVTTGTTLSVAFCLLAACGTKKFADTAQDGAKDQQSAQPLSAYNSANAGKSYENPGKSYDNPAKGSNGKPDPEPKANPYAGKGYGDANEPKGNGLPYYPEEQEKPELPVEEEVKIPTIDPPPPELPVEEEVKIPTIDPPPPELPEEEVKVPPTVEQYPPVPPPVDQYPPVPPAVDHYPQTPPVAEYDPPELPVEEYIPAPKPQAPHKPELPGDVYGGHVEYRRPTPHDQNAIDGCRRSFGNALPFDGSGNVRTIAANISILGGGTTLRDARVTEGPELTIIFAAINVLGSPKWELLNPNGFYCIVTNINVVSRLTVLIDRRAKLADSAVGINILSDVNQQAAAVGINVLSNVKVIQK